MRHLATSIPNPLEAAESLIENGLYEQAKELIVKEEIEAYNVLEVSYDAGIEFFDWLIRENGLSLQALNPSELIKRLPLLDFLVKNHGFDVNEVRNDSFYEYFSILITAIEGRTPYETVEILIKEYGCDVNYCDCYGDTVLKTAVDKGQVKIVRLLLENGADPRIASECKPVLGEEVRIRYPKCTALVEARLKELS